jgi:hypothetical protein
MLAKNNLKPAINYTQKLNIFQIKYQKTPKSAKKKE